MDTNKSGIMTTVEGIIVLHYQTFLIRTNWHMLVTDVPAWARDLLAVEREEHQACLDEGDIESAQEHAQTMAGLESWLQDYSVPDEKELLPFVSFIERQRLSPLTATKTNFAEYIARLLKCSEILETQPHDFMPAFYLDGDRIVLVGTEVIRSALRWRSGEVKGFELK